MPELDAAELREKIALHCRQANYPEPLTDAIHRYLAGTGALAEVEQLWQAFTTQQHQVFVPSLCSLSLSEAGQLHEFDRRRLDITIVTSNTDSLIEGLTQQAPFDDLYRYLQEKPAAQQKVLDYLMPSYNLMEDAQPTPMGHLLLRFLPEHFPAMLPMMKQHNWDYEYEEFLQLLVWVQPPHLDLAWQTAQQAPQGHMGDCAAVLLKADPERFREWTRTLASANGPGDDSDQTAALQAVLEYDIAHHLEIAEVMAAGNYTFANKGQEGQLRKAALEALWRYDAAKYLAPIEAAALGKGWPLPHTALGLLETASFETTRLCMLRCVDSGLPQIAQRAAKRLLENEWAGRDDYALALLSHRSKQVRDLAGEWLTSQGAAMLDRVIPLLKSNNAATRWAVVQVVIKAGGARTAALLAEHFKHEKSVTIKQTIVDVIGLPEVLAEVPLASQIADITTEAAKAGKVSTLRWVNIEDSFGLRWVTGEAVSNPVLHYLLVCQARMKQVQVEMNARRVLGLLDAQTTGRAGLALFTGWVKQGANIRQSWLLPLCGALAGDQLIQPLLREIDRWGRKTRGALAVKAAQALALIGSDLALSEVSDLAQHSKAGRVKAAAREAFAAAASRLGISQEDLADRIAPRFGLNERGERSLDYGPRQFTARLGFDLTLHLFDSTGKRLTAPPRASKHDDPVKVATAQSAWQLLKKSLAPVVARQAGRLEGALATQRTWSVAQWHELFHQHPLLRAFSVALVWGVAAEHGESYALLFRPLEDGTLTDAEDEPVSLPAEGQIRLAHPLELAEQARADWLRHLSDYKITPPFPQLTRPTLALADDQRDAILWETCKGYMVPGNTFVRRYLHAGWLPAEEERGEGYNLIWKAFPAAGIEAMLEIGYLSVGYEGSWPTPLIRLCFARTGTLASIKQASDASETPPYNHPQQIIEHDLLKLG
jgi:hypothetical protein